MDNALELGKRNLKHITPLKKAECSTCLKNSFYDVDNSFNFNVEVSQVGCLFVAEISVANLVNLTVGLHEEINVAGGEDVI